MQVCKVCGDKHLALGFCIKHYWAMRRQNATKGPADMQRNGTNNGRSMLTEYRVLSIYRDLRPHAAIAADHKIARSTVTGIKTGDSWGWLTDKLERERRKK